MHSCMRVIELQLVHQLPQSSLLLRSSCVLWVLAIGSATANITDANAIGIMPRAMCANKMPTADVVHREILAFGSGRAMNNYLIYLSHAVACFECSTSVPPL